MNKQPFIDASEYEELTKTMSRIRNILHSKATRDDHTIVIHRMYVEFGYVSVCFSMDGTKYLLKANLTLQMGEPTEWVIQCNAKGGKKRAITPEELVSKEFLTM